MCRLLFLCVCVLSKFRFHTSFIFQSNENTRPCNVGQANLLPFGLYFAVISWAGPVKGLPSESYLLAFLPVVILHFLFHPQTNDTSSLAVPWLGIPFFSLKGTFELTRRDYAITVNYYDWSVRSAEEISVENFSVKETMTVENSEE